ncbi:hypothetical protein ACSXAY_17545 (plasmid) [Clostridium perfringens]
MNKCKIIYDENLLKRLSEEKFKIKLSVTNNTGFTYYKIELIG